MSDAKAIRGPVTAIPLVGRDGIQISANQEKQQFEISAPGALIIPPTTELDPDKRYVLKFDKGEVKWFEETVQVVGVQTLPEVQEDNTLYVVTGA